MVAVVDDDESLREAIAQLLDACGFATQVFASAEAFLDGSAANGAACFVLDINLTGMSGLELRQRLKAEGSATPVIFITGADDNDIRRQAAEADCVACLRKPFDANLLISAINKAIGE
jgi:FixJ family two-component response regulator